MRISVPLQGPPGTGKSFIAAKVIESLLSLKKTPIVIMAYKNRALDHLLNACYKFSKGGIVRLGKLSEDYAEGRLKKCLLREQMKTFRQPHSVNDPFERKLDVLQKRLAKIKGTHTNTYILCKEYAQSNSTHTCTRNLNILMQTHAHTHTQLNTHLHAHTIKSKCIQMCTHIHGHIHT